MELETIKNMKYVFKKAITSLKKICAALYTYFFFSL